MKKLTKKQGIIIGIVVAIILVVAIVLGVIFAGKNQDVKEKNDTKIETEADKKDDEKESEEETQKEDSEDANTEQEDEEKPEEQQTTQNTTVEEPKQETQNQTSTNTNQNNSNANSGSNVGSTTTTTPSTPVTPTPTPEPEKSPYAGMYTLMDEASKTRFVTCGNILRGGLAGQYIQVRDTFIDYFSGEIVMINGTTDGAWMYLCIAGWSTNGGTAETAPIYDELPSLAKQCMETIAPDGGTALYNTINSLILQYGGARKVPTQGRISESIPGLYVTVSQNRSGLEIEFWAE
ncbi:MAG: hypothetical protein IJZ53_06425 [Tyzzerella sp.]|nr:hypothetical protein [Tyzzerella sp.]